MQHYFTNEPQSKSEPRMVDVQARGQSLKLAVDAGVFSKQGLDFGSRLLVETVDLQGVNAALDLGCGYGPVTALLARVYPQVMWLAVDINTRAAMLAKKNLACLGNRVEVLVSDGIANLPKGFSPDAVLLNPPIRAGKDIVHRLFIESFHTIKVGGSLWVVIQKKQGAPSAKTKLESLFGNVEVCSQEAGYYVFCCKRT